MGIKRILVPLPDSADYSGEIDMALSAAEVLEAHVEALFIRQPPPPPPGVEGMPVRYGSALAVEEPVAWQTGHTEDSERRAREARAAFAKACSDRHIPLADAGQTPDSAPSALWRQAEGT